MTVIEEKKWLVCYFALLLIGDLFISFHLPHSEIQTLKRTVSSPPPTSLDPGSQNSPNHSSSITTACTSDPPVVVCGHFEYTAHRSVSSRQY